VTFASYPKFLAEIDILKESNQVSCRLAQDGEHILSLSCQTGEYQAVGRSYSHLVTRRGDRLLRSESIASELNIYRSKDKSGVELKLGDHPISKQLRKMKLGKMVSYQYIPECQFILTNVIESFPI
jgi:hypothetical protein